MRMFCVLWVVLAMVVPPDPGGRVSSGIRAFWADAFYPGFKTAAQVHQLVSDVVAARANVVVVQVRRRGDSYYVSGVEPRAVDGGLAPLPFDPLGALLAEAHARHVQVHAWVAALPIWMSTWGVPPAGHVLLAHNVGAPGDADWVMRDQQGNVADSEHNIWLDPGHPAVVDYTESVVRDLLRRYPGVDGVHLDRIRYPGTSYGYNPTAVARFNASVGRSGVPDPQDPLWMGWRRAQVTALVRRVSLAVAEMAPRARLSAATIAWGDSPDRVGGWERSTPYRQVMQDWRGWFQERLIDTAVVMNYDREQVPVQRAYFDHWVAWETREVGGPVVVGMAAYLNGVDDTLAQVARAQATSAIGVAFYSYAVTNGDRQPRGVFLDALARGPFAQVAVVPSMPWKTQRGAVRGTLVGAPGLASVDGVVIAMSGPEQLTLVSDGAGWFAAPLIAPGQYRAQVTLGEGRALVATATVRAGGIADLTMWSLVVLNQQRYLPLIAAAS